MNVVRTMAIVLRRTNFGEADRIIQLITPHGKKSAMVKGARKEKSRLSGGIELFAVCDVVISDGRGELGILTSAKLVTFYKDILTDYDRMQFAYLSIKLVSGASEMTDSPEWYNLLFGVLEGLGDLQMPLGLIQTWFYLRYSALMGYELSLQLDVNGAKLTSDKCYGYNSEDRGLEMAENGELTAEHIKLLRLISSKPLKILLQIGGVDAILPICASISREHAAINET